jgi:hypothetical protein
LSQLPIAALYLPVDKISKFIPYDKIPVSYSVSYSYEKMKQAANYLGLNKISNEQYQKLGIMSGGVATAIGKIV